MSTAGLLREVEAGLPPEFRERFFSAESHAGIHLAVMREPFLSYLVAGLKTVESRFSVNRVDPFDRIKSGDLVLLKAGAVVGAFIVDDVDCRLLPPGGISAVRQEFGSEIMADDDFWALKQDARFATLLTVGEIFDFSPFEVSKRDMRGWVVLRAADRELLTIW